MVDIQAIACALLSELEGSKARFGFRGELRADYVSNPGNFISANFTVTDGRVRRHVKLTPEVGELDRWFELREILAERYRAPEILGRVEIAGYEGLVFPHLPGTVATDDLLPAIADLAGRIHSDRDLAARVADHPAPTARTCYFTGVFECLSEDLVSVKADPAVCILLSPADLAFLEGEVENLRRMGEERLPDDRVTTAIHGDLWLQNVLASDTDWHLLDWDFVRIGDPAGEYALLLMDPVGRGVDPDPFLPTDAAFRDRFDLLLRAACFDEIVDPLSDLTMAPEGLPDRDTVWRERHRRSVIALARYRATYG